MNNLLRGVLLSAGFALGAGSAAAQVTGLPVVNSGVTRGLGLAADVGIPNDAAGGGVAFGATAGLGLGPLGFTARVARLDPDAGDQLWSAGATANYKVFGGPLVPLAVTLQAGAGYANPELACVTPGACDVSEWRFPVGVGISFTIPNPALAVKPWIAPRLDMVRTAAYGDIEASTETDFAISGGVELNLLTGLGLQAAYDWSKQDGSNPGIFSAGLHYNFRIPGL